MARSTWGGRKAQGTPTAPVLEGSTIFAALTAAGISVGTNVAFRNRGQPFFGTFLRELWEECFTSSLQRASPCFLVGGCTLDNAAAFLGHPHLSLANCLSYAHLVAYPESVTTTRTNSDSRLSVLHKCLCVRGLYMPPFLASGTRFPGPSPSNNNELTRRNWP